MASARRGLGWSSLPTDGPMARTVEDAALMLSVMASDDPMDPLAYTLPGEAVRGRPGLWSPPDAMDLARLRVAFTEDFGFAPTERHVRRVFRHRVSALAPLVAAAVEATPDCSGADDAFAVLRASLFLAQHGETFRQRPEMLGANVRVNVEEGLSYTLQDYARAASAQTRIYRSFQDFFRHHDVLVSPAVTLSPRPWAEMYPTHIDGAPTAVLLPLARAGLWRHAGGASRPQPARGRRRGRHAVRPADRRAARRGRRRARGRGGRWNAPSPTIPPCAGRCPTSRASPRRRPSRTPPHFRDWA